MTHLDQLWQDAPDGCTYCGVEAEERDHLIPISYDHTDRRHISYSRHQTVPSCRECNSTLSDIYITTIADRAEHLANRYRRRWRSDLAVKQASLTGLINSLRRDTEARLRRRDYLQRRLDHLDLVARYGHGVQAADVWISKGYHVPDSQPPQGDPSERALHRALELHDIGMQSGTITRVLNDEGLYMSSGRLWTISETHALLAEALQ